MADIATGWEESGVAAVYLNPGPERARLPWPSLVLPRAPAVEDVVLTDLDGDGAVDLVSCSEGATRAVTVHWAPGSRAEYTREDAWVSASFPRAQGEPWMFCLPLAIGRGPGRDLVIGSKNQGASVSWLEAPATPRRLDLWQRHRLSEAGWVMSLLARDMDGDGDLDVLLSDRRGPLRGVRWLERPSADAALSAPWRSHWVGGAGREAMFLDTGDLDGDGLEDVVVALAERTCLVLRRLDRSGTQWSTHPLGIPAWAGTGKAVSLGDLDLDGRLDMAVTCEHAGGERRGVFWWSGGGGFLSGAPPARDISGAAGVKFDLAPLLDVDADGDLDAITTEEAEPMGASGHGLGVLWYENPTR